MSEAKEKYHCAIKSTYHIETKLYRAVDYINELEKQNEDLIELLIRFIDGTYFSQSGYNFKKLYSESSTFLEKIKEKPIEEILNKN